MNGAIKRPCAQCPFRKDAPRGVWHRDHYQLLVEMDDSMRPFGCHDTRDGEGNVSSACAGWLVDQRRRGLPSIGVRIFLALHSDEAEGVTDGGLELFDSAREAGVANLAAQRAMSFGWACPGSEEPWGSIQGLKGTCQECGAILPRQLDADDAPRHFEPRSALVQRASSA